MARTTQCCPWLDAVEKPCAHSVACVSPAFRTSALRQWSSVASAWKGGLFSARESMCPPSTSQLGGC
jgi:hypothetical protein